jgi:hypothetical protein
MRRVKITVIATASTGGAASRRPRSPVDLQSEVDLERGVGERAVAPEERLSLPRGDRRGRQHHLAARCRLSVV